MSTSQILQSLHTLGTSSPDISRLIGGLIQRDEEEQYLSSLGGSELVQLVDGLDRVLSTIPATEGTSQQCLHKLQTICIRHAVLPPSYTIASRDVARVGGGPIVCGRFADVWEGTYGVEKVSIQCPRAKDLQAVAELYFKEAIIWKRLRHSNVVPFIEVTRKPLQFVSEWMPNRTLMEYIKKNPAANRTDPLLDVAEGLNYLHENSVVHGNLKGASILSGSF